VPFYTGRPINKADNKGETVTALQSAPLPAGLYLVATPIGNLRDMTLRAIEVLGGVDLILCEDTRVSGKLMQAHGIKDKKLDVYNDHSADRMRPKVLRMIAEGSRVALISDAGTPLISDPGYKLVRDAHDLGLNVTSLPGANAVLTAMQLSGLPTDKFSFIGFLPPKEKARCDVLREWASVPSTLVCYETAPRLIASLKDMLATLGDRDAAVTRELTKMFEEVRRDKLSNLIAWYEANGEPRGEIAVVIAPPDAKVFSDEVIEEMLGEALQTMRVKDAATHVAEKTGISSKKAYDVAIMLQKATK
jgi:16S rRNA (cytidine1402-2'-O)-methyltransferase